jgi:elongation factor P
MPITVDLKVIEAPPNVKGDTMTGGQKTVKLETGATINAPLFVNEGDIIRVNTETEEYRERVK